MIKTDKEKACALAEHISEVFTDEPARDIPTLPTKQVLSVADTEFERN